MGVPKAKLLHRVLNRNRGHKAPRLGALGHNARMLLYIGPSESKDQKMDC